MGSPEVIAFTIGSIFSNAFIAISAGEWSFLNTELIRSYKCFAGLICLRMLNLLFYDCSMIVFFLMPFYDNFSGMLKLWTFKVGILIKALSPSGVVLYPNCKMFHLLLVVVVELLMS